jgi:hypothetical protein
MMIDSLSLVDYELWVCDFVVFLVLLSLALSDRQANSSVITLAVLVLFSGAMDEYAEFLLAVSDPAHITMVRIGWYLGFAAMHILAMKVIYKLHQAFAINYQLLAKICVSALFILSMLQLSRFVERFYFASDYLKSLYQIGIISINIVTTLMIVTIAVMACYHRLHNKEVKRAIWTL